MITTNDQIEWFKGRFKDINKIYINRKDGKEYTTVILQNGTVATVSHDIHGSNEELGILWAYVKAVEKSESWF